MSFGILLEIPDLLGTPTAQVIQAAAQIASNPWLVPAAIILIALTIFLLFVAKQIVVNSILGILAWGIITYLFNVNLPFWPSLIISAIFGLAGVGVMLLLKFTGVF